MSNPLSQRGIRSYVLRTGRMTDSQKRAFAEYWPRFGLSVENGVIDSKKIFGRAAPLILEIGFGMGESLLTMARQGPDTDFIGVEVHTPGVGRLLNQIALHEVSNLRVYQDDALFVLERCLPDNSLSRVQLYFPDPWPKKKHHKRRIVQPDFLRLVGRKLQNGGVFHLATDWQPYADHMLAVFAEFTDRYRNQAGDGKSSTRPDYRPPTKFEQRGRRLGHGVWDLLFEKI